MFALVGRCIGWAALTALTDGPYEMGELTNDRRESRSRKLTIESWARRGEWMMKLIVETVGGNLES